MKWVIDRIEEHIVTIENMETKEVKEISSSLLPASIHEGAVLLMKNGGYHLSLPEEEKRRQSIQEKFEKLKK